MCPASEPWRGPGPWSIDAAGDRDGVFHLRPIYDSCLCVRVRARVCVRVCACVRAHICKKPMHHACMRIHVCKCVCTCCSFMRLPLQEQLNELDLPSEASIRAMVAAPYVPPTDPARFPRAPSLPTCTRSHEANSATRFSGSMVHIPPGLVSMRHMRLPAKLPERELTMQI